MSSQKLNLGSFKEIEEAPSYKVNPLGLIYSSKCKRLLTPYISDEGYMRITLYNNNKKLTRGIHRILGKAFIPNPNNYKMIDHIDKDRKNNDLTNLRWITCSGNNRNKVLKNKKSGLPTGVYKAYKRYAAQIWKDGRRKYLGARDTPEEAAELYKEAYNEIMNEFLPE
tara:strand:- start:2823 stop:3326 length:504 start_codon:yes stop_codon:yes gene_type:complete